MSSPRRHPWLLRLVAELLRGNAAVQDLFRQDPFPDEPPDRVRARLYRYEFTEPAERRETGRWWRRELLGEYLPALSLEDPTVRQVLRAG
ncbi:MAG: lipase maturation factor family protein [Gemmatimonadota bacterium]